MTAAELYFNITRMVADRWCSKSQVVPGSSAIQFPGRFLKYRTVAEALSDIGLEMTLQHNER